MCSCVLSLNCTHFLTVQFNRGAQEYLKIVFTTQSCVKVNCGKKSVTVNLNR